MAEPARHLRAVHPGVDPESGEVVPECPGCKERDRAHEEEVAGLQSTIRSLSAKLRYARQDADAKARADEAWPKALELFNYWMRRTGRSTRPGRKAKFTEDRFRVVGKFIREEGLDQCKLAMDGLLASEWYTKRGKWENRDGPVYDEFERPFSKSDKRSAQANFELFRDAGQDATTRFLEAATPPSEGWLGVDFVMAQLVDD